MSFFRLILNGKTVGEARKLEDLQNISALMSTQCIVDGWELNRQQLILRLRQTPVDTTNIVDLTISAIIESGVEYAYYFGTSGSDIDMAVFFQDSLSRGEFLKRTAKLILRIREFWPSNHIISMNMFSPNKDCRRKKLHLLVYKGFSDFRSCETPLFREAISQTGKTICGLTCKLMHVKVSKAEIKTSLQIHRDALLPAITESLTAYGVSRSSLVLKYFEYHARHLLIALFRYQGGSPSKSLYLKHGLIPILFFWNSRLIEAYLEILSFTYSKRLNVYKLMSYGEDLLNCAEASLKLRY